GGAQGPVGVHQRRVLAALADALADQDQGGRGPGLRGGAGPAGGRGGDEPDAVRGDGGVAARVRGLAGAGHPALADGADGDGTVVLGWYHWRRPGPAGGPRAGPPGGPAGGAGAAALVA